MARQGEDVRARVFVCACVVPFLVLDSARAAQTPDPGIRRALVEEIGSGIGRQRPDDGGAVQAVAAWGPVARQFLWLLLRSYTQTGGIRNWLGKLLYDELERRRLRSAMEPEDSHAVDYEFLLDHLTAPAPRDSLVCSEPSDPSALMCRAR